MDTPRTDSASPACEPRPSPQPTSSRPAPRLLVTAGPTREPIDEVRFVSNRSSGAMGLAIAAAALQRGWPTTLLLGPLCVAPTSSIPPSPLPPGATVERFESTADLQRLLVRHWPESDLLIMAAAVADHRPIRAPGKIRRADGPITLELEPTPDLLGELSTITRPDQRAVGFALEPAERLLASAREKLARKRLYAIVANPLDTMDSPVIDGTLLFADGRRASPPFGRALKSEFAAWLLETLWSS